MILHMVLLVVIMKKMITMMLLALHTAHADSKPRRRSLSRTATTTMAASA